MGGECHPGVEIELQRDSVSLLHVHVLFIRSRHLGSPFLFHFFFFLDLPSLLLLFDSSFLFVSLDYAASWLKHPPSHIARGLSTSLLVSPTRFPSRLSLSLSTPFGNRGVPETARKNSASLASLRCTHPSGISAFLRRRLFFSNCRGPRQKPTVSPLQSHSFSLFLPRTYRDSSDEV